MGIRPFLVSRFMVLGALTDPLLGSICNARSFKLLVHVPHRTVRS